ncbi:MAG: hypothetical protein WCI31_02420 [Prolixibacteraceae bacterium]
MNIIDAIRLIRKHLVLLIATPVILASMVAYLTKNPTLVYSSETTLYTGIASGSSIEMDKAFSFYANNTAFDNLINIIKSRETQQEVAIRMLAQHLMLQKYDPRYISSSSFNDLRRITPKYVQSLVVNSSSHKGKSEAAKAQPVGDQSSGKPESQKIENPDNTEAFSFSKLDTTAKAVSTLPATIDREDYEQTVKNLQNYMASSDTNFVYRLLYFDDPHYSVKALSTVNAQRIGSSDLIKLKFDSDDPGICQQTLAFLTEACIKNYKFTKENRSDAVVKYFEFQLKQSAAKLKIGEDKLLKFNEDNNIINYYEQSKAVANVKENLDNQYNDKRIKLAGTKAAIERIESKLGNQKNVQLKSSSIVGKRDRLSAINSKIATAEIMGNANPVNEEQLIKLKIEAETIKDEIRKSVNELYGFSNSTEGLPISNLLIEWINNVIVYEDTKAGIEVLKDRINEFQKQYSIYAPAGANLKRIEREISVSEQEFLEILHGLNLAKLKVQDAELSSTIKATDPPFYPLSPNPTKRKFLIIVAGMVGFIIVLTSILVLEYFDDTLRNAEKAAKILHLKPIGIFPKIFLKVGSLNFSLVTNRLLELIILQIDLLTNKTEETNKPRTILFFSSLNNEGNTVSAGNIAWKIKQQGKKVLYLNYLADSMQPKENNQSGDPDSEGDTASSSRIPSRKPFRFVRRILGYPDNRVDHSSPFLLNPEANLESGEYSGYHINPGYFSAQEYTDLIENNQLATRSKPDFVLIELPPILYNSYPTHLVALADLAIIVCRANRVWSAADQKALNILMKITTQEPVFLLNGVEIEVIESVLGDLPKKRSWLRKTIKSIVRFQFNSKQEF